MSIIYFVANETLAGIVAGVFFFLLWVLCGKVLVAGWLQVGGFYEKLLEASPMTDRANASRL